MMPVTRTKIPPKPRQQRQSSPLRQAVSNLKSRANPQPAAPAKPGPKAMPRAKGMLRAGPGHIPARGGARSSNPTPKRRRSR